MESWVSTLFKDIREKVGFSGPSSTSSPSSLSSPDNQFLTRTEISHDYFPSRLPPSELRLFIQYILQMRLINVGHDLINMLGRLLFMEFMASESASFAPCLEFDMSKIGHACIAVLLGERPWPPEAGYSFVCWFQYSNLKSHQTEPPGTTTLRLFSVSSSDHANAFSELYLQEDGILNLATNNASSFSCSQLELEEGLWYHLAIVHSTSIVHIYLNGKLRHTETLAYAPTVIEKELQITIGIPPKDARISDLHWKLRSCYLFEEQISADVIHLVYILGRGHKVILQGSDVFHPVSNEPGSGDKFDTFEMLEKLWLELYGKKLVCAFNATRTEALQESKTLTLLNLVDPVSAVALSIGVPLLGLLLGDASICRRCITENIIHPITGVDIVLGLVETAETRDLLHIALTLLASTLYQNPHKVKEMKTCKGYHLLTLFLHRKMPLFDIQCLEILFKIAVSEDLMKSYNTQASLPSSVDIHGRIDDFSPNMETLNHYLDTHNGSATTVISISGALINVDIVEHVLLDWSLWVTAPIFIQLEVLNFLENLVSVYKYKDHNLSVLHELNIVHHLLVVLHRDDIEVHVLEKFAILLTIILEDKFLESELESMTNFLLTTFDPLEVTRPHEIMREKKTKRVILRNILLEALIDLQVTIMSDGLLEKWHRIVSSRLITYFLDEAVHPTSMVWIITLLGLCLTSSPVFSLKFQTGGGHEGLVRVLSTFNDCLDIHYILFCLIFGKPIYPRLPEVGILDFEALMPGNGDYGELKFDSLLDSIIAMLKSSFIIEQVSGEALLHKNPAAAPLPGWEASAANATSVLRLMANLAKMWPSFSNICGRGKFRESCVDTYFSIVRAYWAVKFAEELNLATTPIESPVLVSEGYEFPDTNSSSHRSSAGNTCFLMNSKLLLEIDNSGYSGDPISAGATAILDFITEVLSNILIHQINSVPIVEGILGNAPLYFDSKSVLTFQAVCLGRIMNYLERRILHDDEGTGQKLDKNNLWLNLGSFCNLIVDCVYLGVFPQPSSVIRVLEFCLSMLHSANKDAQIDESWTARLSIWRGIRPTHMILKSTNRMILYCFLPSFLVTIGDDTSSTRQKELEIDICMILELLYAHREVIFNPSNLDTDLYCSLCINLIAFLHDHRKNARNEAISILKYLLVHCRASLENVLISKDLLNGGFEKLLSENVSSFMEWFTSSEDDIKQVLQQFAMVRWSQYIEKSENFHGERLRVLEDNRRRKMERKGEDEERLEIMYWNQEVERRSMVEMKRVAVCTELELACQKKSELVVHAESEWRSCLQQLGHEHKVELISSMAWEDYWPLC